MKNALTQRRKSVKAKLGLLASVILAAAGATPDLHAQVGPVEAGGYTGGGFIQSAAGAPGKATFGFNLEGVDGDGDGFVDRQTAYVPAQVFGPLWPPMIFVIWWEVGQGQFQYNDHGAGVKFHLDHDASYEVNPDGGGANPNSFLPADRLEVRSLTTYVIDPYFRFVTTIQGFTWIGTYYSSEGTGRVKVSVNAEEDAFDSLVDTISVRVESGPYGPGGAFGFFGYRNSGVVKGGNIQWHPAAE